MAFSESSPTEHVSSTQNVSSTSESQSIEIPARYAREIQARERLHDACPVDVYVAGINPRYSWPHRLVAANKACLSVIDSAETVIIDSVVTNPYYSNRAILDTAHELDTEYVIGKDWPPAADPCDRGGIQPVDALDHFMGEYTCHECDADVIVPVFPPFDAQKLQGLRKDWINYYALGGMRDMSGEQQVAHIRQFRDLVGDDVNAHGLGVGTSVALINAIRDSIKENPDAPLLDSLDISTPETAVANNKIPTKRWHQQRVQLPTGDESTTVRAGFAEAIARMLEYELTPECDDEMFDTADFATFR
jgi:sulfur carrier protein ThiS